MRKIKVLYTISELVYGSKVRQLIDLLKEIDQDKFDVEIGTYHISDEASNDVLSFNVPIRQIWLQPPRDFNFSRLTNFLKSPIIISKQYDVIHSLHYSSLFYESFISRFLGISYIYTKSNLKWENHPINWKLKSIFSDKIIAISNEVNNLLINKGFKEKTILLPVGVDVSYFSPSSELRFQARNRFNIPSDAFVFGCAAQFIETKKQDLVINAFHELTKKYNDIYLVLCGQNYCNDYYTKIMHMLNYVNSNNNVINLGIVSDMRSFYNMIDCFVLPSIDEALGLVFLEAMSSCVPVIGCKDTGASDIIQDKCGTLIPKNSLISVINAMEYYLHAKDNLHKIGKVCRNIVDNKFSNKYIVRLHEDIYSSMIASKKYL